jgi:hypothetical protein
MTPKEIKAVQLANSEDFTPWLAREEGPPQDWDSSWKVLHRNGHRSTINVTCPSYWDHDHEDPEMDVIGYQRFRQGTLQAGPLWVEKIMCVSTHHLCPEVASDPYYGQRQPITFLDPLAYKAGSLSTNYWNAWRVLVNTDTGGLQILEQLVHSLNVKPDIA